MVMRALIQVEDTYKVIFYPICNFMCFYPKSTTATLYCLTCKCFLSVYNVLYFRLNFYSNFANEFLTWFEITY